MPFATLNTVRLHYRIDGAEHLPWLLLCNSLGTDLLMWDAQIDALSAHFRVLRYDRRGHGESSAPPSPYTIDDLGRDVLGLLDALEIPKTHFCGLSIGGLVGQWLALNATERIERLVLCSTAAKIGTEEGWRPRIAQVRDHGLESIADATVLRWFTPAFVEREPAVIEAIRTGLLHTSKDAYIGCCEALIHADFRADLGHIRMPLLAIAGNDDPVTTPDDLRHIADQVGNGRYAEVAGRHICNIESAAEFNAALTTFLKE
jgi:3-oxoadipate enol-lactonase